MSETITGTAAPRLAPGSSQVGTLMVHQALGVDRIRALPGFEDANGPLGSVVAQIVRTARQMDHIQGSLVGLAEAIQRDMQQIIDGKDVDLPQTHGVVGTTALSVDLLIARRAELHERLTDLIETHRSFAARPPAAEQSAAVTAEATACRADPQVALTPMQEKALAVIAAGGVRVLEGGIRGTRRATAPGSVRIYASTVDSLVGKGLVELDTSTSLYAGQAVFLTAAGRERHAALATSPRTSAARTRSTATASSSPADRARPVVSAPPDPPNVSKGSAR